MLQNVRQMRSGGRIRIPLSAMSQPAPYSIAREPMPDHEQKQAALSYLNEAWAEARHDGVDGDCLAQARNPYSRWWLWIPGSRFARPG